MFEINIEDAYILFTHALMKISELVISWKQRFWHDKDIKLFEKNAHILCWHKIKYSKTMKTCKSIIKNENFT
jgi:5-bromo-4-chloroindolyl phosphate hydrolysis protein